MMNQQWRRGFFLLLIPLLSAFSQNQAVLRSVAVLRFELRSASTENDWLGFGFAETLTSKLGMVDGLMVMERTKLFELLSIAGKSEPLDETQVSAGEEYARIIGAEYLLIGSVQVVGSYKNTSTAIKVNARIIKTSSAEITGNMAFSVSGTVQEIFELQTQLATRFCEVIGAPAGLAELRYEDAQSIDAQQWYGRGLQAFYESNYAQAITCFRRAINQNEGVFYAAAHTMEGMARQKQIDRANAADKQTYKQQYLDQFRKDAGEASPAFYDLGIAHQAAGNYTESIKNFRTFLAYLDRTRQLVVQNPFTGEETSAPEESYPYVFETANGLRVSTEEGKEILYYPDPEINSDAKILIHQDTLFVMANSIFAFALKPGRFLWKYPQGIRFDYTMVAESGRLYIVGFDQIQIFVGGSGERMAYWRMPALTDLNYIRIARGIFWSGYDSIAYNLNALLSNRPSHSEIDAWFQIGRSYEDAGQTDSALCYYDDVLKARGEYIEALDHKSSILNQTGKTSEAVKVALDAVRYGVPCRSRDLLYACTGLSGYTSVPGWMSHVETADTMAYIGVGTPGFVGKAFSKIYGIHLRRMQSDWAFDFQCGSYMPSFTMNKRTLFAYKPVENKYALIAIARLDGQLLWQNDLRASYIPSEYYDEFIRPAASDNVVVSVPGSVSGWNASDGKRLWQITQSAETFDENPDGWVLPAEMNEGDFNMSYLGGTPLAINHRFYVSSPKTLWCISEEGKKLWQTSTAHHKLSLRYENSMISVQDFIASDTAKRFYDPMYGRRLASAPDREFHRVHKDETHSAFDGKHVYTLEEYANGITVKKQGSGVPAHSEVFQLTNYSTDMGKWITLADDEIWVLLGYLNQDGTDYGGVVVLDAPTLRCKWKLDIGKNVVHMFATKDAYFIFCSRGDIIRMSKTKMNELLARGQLWWKK